MKTRILLILFLAVSLANAKNPYEHFGYDNSEMESKMENLRQNKFILVNEDSTSEISALFFDFNLAKVSIIARSGNVEEKEIPEEMQLRWNSLDPKASSFVSYSPYNSMLNNPISNIDPNGDSTFAYGKNANDFVDGLNIRSKNLNFIYNKSNSQVTAERIGSDPLTKAEQLMYDATVDTKNNVNIFADKIHQAYNEFGKQVNINLGLFGGSIISSYGTNEALQYLDYNQIDKATNNGIIKKGDTEVHEFLEAYMGVTKFPNDYENSHNASESLFSKTEVKFETDKGLYYKLYITNLATMKKIQLLNIDLNPKIKYDLWPTSSQLKGFINNGRK